MPSPIAKIGLFFKTFGGFLSSLPGGLRALEERVATVRTRIAELDSSFQKESRQVLFGQIGRALTAWSKMEEGLVIILSMLLRTHPDKAGLILYSILNFSVWLSLINDFFDLDDNYRPYKKRWNKISERLRKIKDRRDQLAHHSVRMTPEEGQETAVHSPRGDVRQKTLSQKPMTLTEVSVFIDSVLDISDDLHELIAEMKASALDASLRKSAELRSDHSPEPGSQ